MHELGIVYEVIKIVDAFAVENNLTRVDTIILEIGQLSQTIPHFVEACYPAAVSETPYEDTKLEIIVLPATGECQSCHKIYNVVDHRKICPNCQGEDFSLISGREFSIKEVVAY
ncbi:hydrogenase maturation nickel metallochaperone HypA [Acetobacterium sp. KB-1]|jgi:hydrogenase nickel incorporation protein HypA/HybF|uniref:hydrogenase maturation nickel metallochaperone HypA/HybF n=1 Tax=Acetobacterium sp. KB-1 TaxID=2184575 RepID=UPI000DBEB60F|nr:hydrogenase maturation nickel metallochaperone HypA [Acetobacterium sp. KB-1]AWW25566.1 hydrogenase maturation nickel metallochaperone HypA [Acetobacterium sp. KB-1]